MDKLLEHPEFTGGISRIRHAAFVTGEESGWANLKAQVDAETYDPSVSNLRSSHSSTLDDALQGFATMDFAGLLRLGNLDVDAVRALCTFDDSDEGLGELGAGTIGGGRDGVGGSGGGDGDWDVGGACSVGAVGDSGGDGDGDGGGVDETV
ncbi:glycine-rich cell wall structural protein 1.8-like [Lactuca sativa]|uniref:glycine-rich cell wall structural protein 1.8-like n=1 Tax=Lactuca sativa TaxID=4236 RepID=UPI000CD99563|nr:glycine-rich cell wall structural protein 1.8-like [Lactuca sativa]